MNFQFMLVVLRNGKKVRRSCWIKGSYIVVRGNQIVNDRGDKVKFSNINCFNVNDYEIV